MSTTSPLAWPWFTGAIVALLVMAGIQNSLNSQVERLERLPYDSHEKSRLPVARTAADNFENGAGPGIGLVALILAGVGVRQRRKAKQLGA